MLSDKGAVNIVCNVNQWMSTCPFTRICLTTKPKTTTIFICCLIFLGYYYSTKSYHLFNLHLKNIYIFTTFRKHYIKLQSCTLSLKCRTKYSKETHGDNSLTLTDTQREQVDNYRHT